MSDHQIIEISCIYTTNWRCLCSHKHKSLTCKYHHKSLFLMITWKLFLVTAVILSIEMLGFSWIDTWFRPKEFCGKYKSVGSVSLFGIQGSGSVPGHPGWPIYVQMAIRTSFPVNIQLKMGSGSSFRFSCYCCIVAILILSTEWYANNFPHPARPHAI